MRHTLIFAAAAIPVFAAAATISPAMDAAEGAPWWWSIDGAVSAQLPQGYAMRPLAIGDYDAGFLTCLSQLTVVGDVSYESFAARFDYMRARDDTYMPVVVERRDTPEAAPRVVAAGTLVLERKFVHDCGTLAHVEDVVVDSEERGTGLGKLVVNQLRHLAAVHGAYKITLDCAEKNEAFYAKSEFEHRGTQMVIYLPQNE